MKVCNGICLKYKIKKQSPKTKNIYKSGVKRCSSCAVYLEWKGFLCPCCGHFLRNKPRNSRARNKIISNNDFKNIQTKLKLNQDIMNLSQRLFKELVEKIPFKFHSSNVVIGTCVFIASHVLGKFQSLEKICKSLKINKNALKFCCEMALNEVKPILIKIK